MSKLFTHAGFSKLNGVYKARFANDVMRVKVLEKGGHEDIQITGLMEPMTKSDAVAYLLNVEFAGDNALARAALEAELDKRFNKIKGEDARAERKSKAKKPVSMDTIKAKIKPAKTKAEILDELEDTPF